MHTSPLPTELATLVAHLKKLPGVGLKTAERFAFEFLKWPQESLSQLGKLLNEIHAALPPCSICGCLTDRGTCRFCTASDRDPTALCIVASPRDVYSMEETKNYKGLYHVLEHLISPLDGRPASLLKIDRIEARLKTLPIREVILALDATLEGDTTALYLKGQLSAFPVSLSRLAFGLPVGSSFESIDGGTLARAFSSRQKFAER